MITTTAPHAPGALHTIDPSAGATSDAGNLQAWLREMEQARWEARPQDDRQGGIHAHDPGDAAAQSSPPPRQLVASKPDHRDVSTGTLPSGMCSQPRAQAATSPVHFPASMAASLGSTRTDVPNGPLALLQTTLAPCVAPFHDSHASKPGTTQTPQADAAEGRFLPASASEPWQAQSVHVEHMPQGLAVWLRDTRLSAHDAVRLLERLRRGLHCPVHLTWNGQPVAANADADAMPIPPYTLHE